MNRLTPAQQRALLQLLESAIITAVIAGLWSIGPLITTDGPIDWRQIAIAFGLAAAFSIAHSVVAYFKPSNAVLSAALESVVAGLEKKLQPAPLQGIQGPLVVVHPPSQAPMPQFTPESPKGESSTSVYPNIQISAPVPPMPQAGNTTVPLEGLEVATEDTVPRAAILLHQQVQ